MEGKTNFLRRLKQFDGLTWLTPSPVILRQFYATGCDLWEESVRRAHQDAVHGAQYHRQRVVVEDDDDADRRQLVYVVLVPAALRPAVVRDVALQRYLFAQSHITAVRNQHSDKPLYRQTIRFTNYNPAIINDLATFKRCLCLSTQA